MEVRQPYFENTPLFTALFVTYSTVYNLPFFSHSHTMTSKSTLVTLILKEIESVVAILVNSPVGSKIIPKLLLHILQRPEYQLSGLELLASVLPPLLPENLPSVYLGPFAHSVRMRLREEDIENLIRNKRDVWSDTLTQGDKDKSDPLTDLISILALTANREVFPRLCEVLGRIVDLGGKPAEKTLAIIASLLESEGKEVNSPAVHRLTFILWYISTLPSGKLGLITNEIYKNSLSSLLTHPSLPDKVMDLILRTIGSLLCTQLGISVPPNEDELPPEVFVDNLPPSVHLPVIVSDLLHILSEFKSNALSGTALLYLADLSSTSLGARAIISASHATGQSPLRPFLTKLIDSIPTNHSPEKKSFLGMVELLSDFLFNIKKYASPSEVASYVFRPSPSLQSSLSHLSFPLPSHLVLSSFTSALFLALYSSPLIQIFYLPLAPHMSSPHFTFLATCSY